MSASEWPELDAAWAHDLEYPDEPPQFVLDGIREVSWLLRRISRLKARIGAVEVAWAAEVQQWKAWRDGQTQPLEREVDRLTALAEGHALALRAADPNTKSITTPYGKVETRAGRSSVKVTDPALLVSWLKEHDPHLVHVKTEEDFQIPELLKAYRKTAGGDRLATADAELVPGLEIETGPTTATAKADQHDPTGELWTKWGITPDGPPR